MAGRNSGPYDRERDDLHMPTIGKRIEALRIAKGLSQTALAKRVGISQPSLSNIEKDKTETLRGETLAGLCAALDVSPDVILRGRGRDPESILFERELVAAWREMTPEDQQHLLAVARALRERMRAARLLPSPKARDSTPALPHVAHRED